MRHSQSFLISTFAALSLLNCATPRAVSTERPIPRQAGKPLTVDILGATYKVPKEYEVTDHSAQPGKFTMDLTDSITGCEGFALFQTTGDPEAHNKAAKAINETIEKRFQKKGIDVKSKVETTTVAGTTAHINKMNLSLEDSKSGGAVLDAHAKNDDLSMIGYLFCKDPSVLSKGIKSLVALYSSRTTTDTSESK